MRLDGGRHVRGGGLWEIDTEAKRLFHKRKGPPERAFLYRDMLDPFKIPHPELVEG
jgi:hypothetical protein